VGTSIEEQFKELVETGELRMDGSECELILS
jgi:hypothetical protein